MLASDWQNPLLETDVDDDGDVSPIDALLLINELNTIGSHEVGEFDNELTSPTYLDVNGDGQFVPLDALLVINRLNQGVSIRELSLQLKNDSGSSASDNVTNDPRVSGQITAHSSPVVRAKARFNRDFAFDVTFNDSGAFSLDSASIEDLVDGNVQFRIHLTDSSGKESFGRYRFELDRIAPELAPPSLVAEDDTGLRNNDGVTKNTHPRIVGLAEPGADLTVLVGGQIKLNMVSGGSYEFLSDTLTDGSYLVAATAIDTAGNMATASTVMTIDNVAAVPSLELSETSDSDPRDATTSFASVTLVGTAEPGALLELAQNSAKTYANLGGRFYVPQVQLSDGNNPFTVHMTDLAGNISQATAVFTRQPATAQVDPIIDWNHQALESVRLDAATPLTASRLLAMQHLAMLDAINAIDGTPGKLVTLPAVKGSSVVAAAVAAAHRVLSNEFPAQKTALDAKLTTSLAAVPNGNGKTDGIALGQAIADAVIAIRHEDGSDAFKEYFGKSGSGGWQATAPMYDVPLSPQWGDVRPFAVTDVNGILPAGPPELTSQEYATALNEVKQLGAANSAARTADQSQIAAYWADGRGTYTPPGQWNQITETVTQSKGLSIADSARIFALLNSGLADAAILAWKVKYDTGFWRPITAIQNAAADGNDATEADPDWTPQLVTPPFPEYVSGHSTFSGAAATILASLFGDNTSFTVGSITAANLTRSFSSFSSAAEEASFSRVLGGIHYRFSGNDGLALGQKIGQQVLSSFATSEDTHAPTIVIRSAPAASRTNMHIDGQVLDNLTGVRTLMLQVDDRDPVPVQLNSNGSFSVTTTWALDGTADGARIYKFIATDASGNSSTREVPLTLDTKPPVITISSLVDNANLDQFSRLSGNVDAGGSSIVSLTYALDDLPAVPFSLSDSTNFDHDLDMSRLTIGAHNLVIKATDAAGNQSQKSVPVNMLALAPFKLTTFTPTSTAEDVGVTFRPQVFFSRPIDINTLNSSSFYATDPSGAKIPATIVPSSDSSFAWMFFTGPLPGASTITMHVDGWAIRALGDGALLDGDSDGEEGGEFTWDFSTISLAGLPGTKLVGTLADPGPDLHPGSFDDVRPGPDGVLMTADDVYLNPIAHVKVTIFGMESQAVFTDSQGRFELTNIPAGHIKVAIDGQTATGTPSGIYFPEMVMDLNIRPAETNTVMATMESNPVRQQTMLERGVYLPRLQRSLLASVSSTQPTTVTVDARIAPDLPPEDLQHLTLTVQPGSILGANGLPLANPKLGISTVPPELVQGMLPPGLREQHTFEITIQAPGATVFATPIAITFPNFQNATPGTQVNIFSFDHTTGLVVPDGTGTVSIDGQFVVSDPGSGIRAPGWHFVQVGTTAIGQPCTAKQCAQFVGGTGDVITVNLSGTVALSEPPPPGKSHNFRIGRLNANGTFSPVSSFTFKGNVANNHHYQIASKDATNLDIPTVDALSSHGVTFNYKSGTSRSVITGNFADTGVFYFIPTVTGLEDGTSGTFEAPFVATLYRTSDSNDKGETLQGLLQIDVRSGGANLSRIELSGAVGETENGNIRLDVYKVQQRLRYLNFRGEKSTATGENPKIEVNGTKDDTLVQAINLFEAVVRSDGKGRPSNTTKQNGTAQLRQTDSTPQRFELTDSSFDWINRINAPRWYDFRSPQTDQFLDKGDIKQEFWATSWTRDLVLQKASVASITSLTEFPDAYTFRHGEHHAGNTIDEGFNEDYPETQAAFTDLQLSTMTKEQMRAELGTRARTIFDHIKAYHDAAQGVWVHVYVGATATTYARLRQVLKAYDINAKNAIGHDTHFHILIHPPTKQGLLPLAPKHQRDGITLFRAASSEDGEGGAVSNIEGFGTDPRLYFRFELANGFVIHGRSDDRSILSSVMTADINFTLTYYQASTNRSAVYHSRTNKSGLITYLPSIILDQFGGPDTDEDGLPDVGERAIGTSMTNADTDRDGIGDAAEIEQGLDPLDDRGFPTGVIASLPIRGESQEVVVNGTTAYVATGSSGLAIVDISRFNKPILLSTLGLGGNATDVAIAPSLGLVAVTTNSNVSIIDVSQPRKPTLVRTLGIAGSRLEIVDGIAFIAAGGSLVSVDMLSGLTLQTLALGGTLTDVVREGSFLYSMNSSNVIQAIDISGSQMVLRGAVTLPVGGKKLFVGNGIAYAAASDFRADGGYATADVSNPDSLRVLGFTKPSDRRPGSSIAANGSGLVLLAGTLVEGTNFATPRVLILDGRDPVQTDSIMLGIDMPQSPRGVGIASGIAFVAGGPSGLQIVNYLPFDSRDQAPTVTITSPTLDLDPTTPGTQIMEGSTVQVIASVEDDVQVRNVELLVNGTVVLNDVSFPFDLKTVAPRIGAGTTQVQFQVRATDTGGNAALSNVITMDLSPDKQPPAILVTDPPNGTSQVEGQFDVRFLFTEPMDRNSVNSSSVHLRDFNGNITVPSYIQFRQDDRLVQATFFAAASTYELVLSEPLITDRAGNPLGSGEFVKNYSLTSRVGLTSSASDDDPTSPGLQLFEGKSLQLSANVTNGVWVSKVDFLLNGKVIGSDSFAPFQFGAVAPNIVENQRSFTLQARVTDTRAFTTTSSPIVVGLVEDITPPTITSHTPQPASQASTPLKTVQVRFSEPMSRATVNSGTIRVQDGAGNFLHPTEFNLLDDDQLAELSFSTSLLGEYQIVSSPTVTDRAGNLLGSRKVVDQGFATGSFGGLPSNPQNNGANFRAAENFTVVSTQSIEAVSWIGSALVRGGDSAVDSHYRNPTNDFSGFSINIFSSTGGANSQPATLHFSEAFEIAKTNQIAAGPRYYQHNVVLGSPFVAQAGVEYWLSIQALVKDPESTTSDNYLWGLGKSGDQRARSASTDQPVTWDQTNAVNLGFTLNTRNWVEQFQVVPLAFEGFTNSADFVAALGQSNYFVETYEDLPLNTSIPYGTTRNGITYQSRPGTITQSTFLTGKSLAIGDISDARGVTQLLALQFPQPITAFGIRFHLFEIEQNGNFFPPPSITLFSSSGIVQRLFGGPPDYFLGFISNAPVTSIHLAFTTPFLSTWEIQDLRFDDLILRTVAQPQSLNAKAPLKLEAASLDLLRPHINWGSGAYDWYFDTPLRSKVANMQRSGSQERNANALGLTSKRGDIWTVITDDLGNHANFASLEPNWRASEKLVTSGIPLRKTSAQLNRRFKADGAEAFAQATDKFFANLERSSRENGL